MAHKSRAPGLGSSGEGKKAMDVESRTRRTEKIASGPTHLYNTLIPTDTGGIFI